MIRGLLISVSLLDANGNDTDVPQVDLMAKLVTADEALEQVRVAERHDIGFDASNDNREITAERLAEVEALTWGEPRADGQHAIDSVNQLGIAEGGFEYRFVPIGIVA